MTKFLGFRKSGGSEKKGETALERNINKTDEGLNTPWVHFSKI